MRLLNFHAPLFFCLGGLFLLASGAWAGPVEMADPIGTSTQLILVTTADWGSVPGKLRQFSRHDAAAKWQQMGSAVPVVVGRNGLGWGKGLNPPVSPAASTTNAGPVKQEGDGKSPAGIFRLSSAFGMDAPNPKLPFKLPYRQLTSGIECVDDVASTHYNSIVDREKTTPADWHSSEKMLGVGENYRLGVVVDHNVDPRQPGGGSCIFLHVWTDAKTGTSGCTAMTLDKMKALVAWLDPARQPLLVQLPEPEYQRLRKLWKLP